MGALHLFRCLGLLLVLHNIEARNVKLVPAETKTITTNGATHEISRYLLVTDEPNHDNDVKDIANAIRLKIADKKNVGDNVNDNTNIKRNNDDAKKLKYDNVHDLIKTISIMHAKHGSDTKSEQPASVKHHYGSHDKNIENHSDHENTEVIGNWHKIKNNGKGVVEHTRVTLNFKPQRQMAESKVIYIQQEGKDKTSLKQGASKTHYHGQTVQQVHVATRGGPDTSSEKKAKSENLSKITKIKYSELPIKWDEIKSQGNDLTSIGINKTFTIPGKRGRFKLLHEQDDYDDVDAHEKHIQHSLPKHKTVAHYYTTKYVIGNAGNEKHDLSHKSHKIEGNEETASALNTRINHHNNLNIGLHQKHTASENAFNVKKSSKSYTNKGMRLQEKTSRKTENAMLSINNSVKEIQDQNPDSNVSLDDKSIDSTRHGEDSLTVVPLEDVDTNVIIQSRNKMDEMEPTDNDKHVDDEPRDPNAFVFPEDSYEGFTTTVKPDELPTLSALDIEDSIENSTSEKSIEHTTEQKDLDDIDISKSDPNENIFLEENNQNADSDRTNYVTENVKTITPDKPDEINSHSKEQSTENVDDGSDENKSEVEKTDAIPDESNNNSEVEPEVQKTNSVEIEEPITEDDIKPSEELGNHDETTPSLSSVSIERESNVNDEPTANDVAEPSSEVKNDVSVQDITSSEVITDTTIPTDINSASQEESVEKPAPESEKLESEEETFSKETAISIKTEGPSEDNVTEPENNDSNLPETDDTEKSVSIPDKISNESEEIADGVPEISNEESEVPDAEIINELENIPDIVRSETETNVSDETSKPEEDKEENSDVENLPSENASEPIPSSENASEPISDANDKSEEPVENVTEISDVEEKNYTEEMVEENIENNSNIETTSKVEDSVDDKSDEPEVNVDDILKPNAIDDNEKTTYPTVDDKSDKPEINVDDDSKPNAIDDNEKTTYPTVDDKSDEPGVNVDDDSKPNAIDDNEKTTYPTVDDKSDEPEINIDDYSKPNAIDDNEKTTYPTVDDKSDEPENNVDDNVSQPNAIDDNEKTTYPTVDDKSDEPENNVDDNVSQPNAIDDNEKTTYPTVDDKSDEPENNVDDNVSKPNAIDDNEKTTYPTVDDKSDEPGVNVDDVPKPNAIDDNDKTKSEETNISNETEESQNDSAVPNDTEPVTSDQNINFPSSEETVDIPKENDNENESPHDKNQIPSSIETETATNDEDTSLNPYSSEISTELVSSKEIEIEELKQTVPHDPPVEYDSNEYENIEPTTKETIENYHDYTPSTESVDTVEDYEITSPIVDAKPTRFPVNQAENIPSNIPYPLPNSNPIPYNSEQKIQFILGYLTSDNMMQLLKQTYALGYGDIDQVRQRHITTQLQNLGVQKISPEYYLLLVERIKQLENVQNDKLKDEVTSQYYYMPYANVYPSIKTPKQTKTYLRQYLFQNVDVSASNIAAKALSDRVTSIVVYLRRLRIPEYKISQFINKVKQYLTPVAIRSYMNDCKNKVVSGLREKIDFLAKQAMRTCNKCRTVTYVSHNNY